MFATGSPGRMYAAHHHHCQPQDLFALLKFRYSLTGDHLEETSTRGIELIETDSSGQHSVQRAEDERDNNQHSEGPPRHARVAGIICYKDVLLEKAAST